MIESEERRVRIYQTIERWCDNTKITPRLRSYDIPGLVTQIMEEFYTVHLCCGHLVKNTDEGVAIAWKEGAGEVSGLYCRDCADEYKRELGAWEIEE